MSTARRFLLLVTILPWLPLCAQQTPLSRQQAIAAAVSGGLRIRLAATDTLAAAAELLLAGQLPNPSLSASYSKSVPQYHVTAELPLDFIGLRGLRIQAAESLRAAAQYQVAVERAAATLEVDTSYTRALAAAAHRALSARNAAAADSLRRIAVARRDAGDASELDVQLATVTAGQAANVAADDSLLALNALFTVQQLIGITSQSAAVMLTDSLAFAPRATDTLPPATLAVAGAEATLQSAELTLKAQQRSRWLFPGITFGFETGDPTHAEPGILPTFGITLPLPLFNRNGGAVAEADAARLRATVQLETTRREAVFRIGEAQRILTAATARLARDASLITSANRVAAMSLAAYREGAAPLSTVLDAQRAARDVLAQYIDDVAAASVAAATLHAWSLTPTSVSMQ